MDILEYTFFQYAILGSLLASIACGIIGTYIVTRRMVFISGGIAHASFGGVGIGLYTGLSPLVCAGFFAVLCAFGVQWASKQKGIREDSAIAVIWTLGMAIGIIFSFMGTAYSPDLSAYLFGNILTIGKGDICFLGVVVLLVAVIFTLCIHAIVSLSFDREFSRSQQLPVEKLECLLLFLIALTIVACLRLVGIVLVISLLTIPQITVNLFTNNFRAMMCWSALVGFIDCLGGLFVSSALSVPSGATIIFFSILVYVMCKIATMRKKKSE